MKSTSISNDNNTLSITLTSLVPLGLVGASQSSSVGACEGLKYVFTCQGNQPHYNSRYQAGRVAPVV